MTIENIVFSFGFALQIFAWILAGASIGFRPRNSLKKVAKKWYTTVFMRRVFLLIGACIVGLFAFADNDFILLGGQVFLFIVLWFRVAIQNYENTKS